MEQVRAQLHVSERRACAALGQHRSTQRKVPRGRDDEQRLIADIIELARQYGRYGYRKIAALLRPAGAGQSTTSGSSVSGNVRGCRFPISNPSAAGSGWLTDLAFGCGRSSAIFCLKIGSGAYPLPPPVGGRA